MASERDKAGGAPPSGAKAAAPRDAGERPGGGRHETSDAGSLGQLREILFGTIQRDLERRLARADAHLASRAHDLELEGQRRIEVLEAHLRKETEAIVARLERELAERGDVVRAMAREHRESLTALEQRVGRAEEAILRAQRELRQQLLEQAKAFLDEIRGLKHEFAETLERELGLAEDQLDEAGRGEEARPTP